MTPEGGGIALLVYSPLLESRPQADFDLYLTALRIRVSNREMEGIHSPEASQTSQVFEECYQINPQTGGIKGPGAKVSICTDWCDPQKMYMDIRWQVPQLKLAEHSDIIRVTKNVSPKTCFSLILILSFCLLLLLLLLLLYDLNINT